MINTQVIIIGAGPAGISCAMQLKRYGIETLLLEKDSIGGLAKNANLIENYIGFPNGITGKYFISLLEKQAQSNLLNVKFEIVESVIYIDESFQITTSRNKYTSKYLVVASGTKPIIPKIYNIELKRKIFTEVSDLGNVKNKEIIIIGAGDCAFDSAMNLASENSIIILNRSTRIKAIPILQERVFSSNSIKYFDNTIAELVSIDDTKLHIACSKKMFISDYLLIAVGRKPNLDFIDRQTLDKSNLYQIGDVKNRLYRQTSIAIGDGITAAMKIYGMMK